MLAELCLIQAELQTDLLGGLDALAQPVAALAVGDVHVLVADVAAVGLPEALQHLVQRAYLPPLMQEARHVPVAHEEPAGMERS